MRRSMRLAEAPDMPDLTERIVAVAAPPPREHWGLRVPLIVVALLQCGLGIAQLLGVHVGHAVTAGAGAGHLGNESAAWNLAVGVGLLWAALRPHAAAGLLPALTAFAGVLAVVSVADLATGAVTATRVLSHGILVAGICLLLLVRHRYRTTGPASSAAPAAEDEPVEGPPQQGTLALAAGAEWRKRRGPSARHDAA
ncbi:hypothetical protein GCM10009675_33630 [Prauserella alba]|uniref:SPW repeat-containing protein n=1 Tax=Prauserella alba TaxID=176898 RepID=A0ABP4G1N8_9PSEU